MTTKQYHISTRILLWSKLLVGTFIIAAFTVILYVFVSSDVKEVEADISTDGIHFKFEIFEPRDRFDIEIDKGKDFREVNDSLKYHYRHE